MSTGIVSHVDVISAVLWYRFIDEDSRRGLENFFILSLLRNPPFRSLVESVFKGKYNEMEQHLNTGLFSRVRNLVWCLIHSCLSLSVDSVCLRLSKFWESSL